MVLGCGGQWNTAPWTAAIIANSTRRAALIMQYINRSVLAGMDGLSLDVEFDGSAHNRSWYSLRKQLLTTFACELRQTLRALSFVPDTFRVSFASDILPAASSDRFDYQKLAACIDLFTPMAYRENCPPPPLKHTVTQQRLDDAHASDDARAYDDRRHGPTLSPTRRGTIRIPWGGAVEARTDLRVVRPGHPVL